MISLNSIYVHLCGCSKEYTIIDTRIMLSTLTTKTTHARTNINALIKNMFTQKDYAPFLNYFSDTKSLILLYPFQNHSLSCGPSYIKPYTVSLSNTLFYPYPFPTYFCSHLSPIRISSIPLTYWSNFS